jgi:hypothetical protein
MIPKTGTNRWNRFFAVDKKKILLFMVAVIFRSYQIFVEFLPVQNLAHELRIIFFNVIQYR